jgi:hypothetical protein
MDRQLEEAAAMKKEVIQKMKRTLGEGHPKTISAINNLAVTLVKQGQLKEAAAIMKEVFEKRKRILSEDHPDTISAMNNLAITLSGQGQPEEGGGDNEGGTREEEEDSWRGASKHDLRDEQSYNHARHTKDSSRKQR